jgi:hypothetical protein
MSKLPNTVEIFDDGSGVFSDSVINQVQADISKGLIINNFPPGSTFTLTDTNGNTFNFTNNISFKTAPIKTLILFLLNIDNILMLLFSQLHNLHL